MNKNYINYLNEKLSIAKNQWRELDLEQYDITTQMEGVTFKKFLIFMRSLLLVILILFMSNPFLIGLVAGFLLFSYLGSSKIINTEREELYERREEILMELSRLKKVISEKSKEIAEELNEDKTNHVREDKYIYEDEVSFEDDKEMSLGLKKK